MKNLFCRSEYSYKFACGSLKAVIEAGGHGIADRNGTWGHVEFATECSKVNQKPVFGVELAIVEKLDRERKPAKPPVYYRFLAKNNEGLAELYKLVTLATRNFYYIPRLTYSNLDSISENVFIIAPDYDFENSTQNSLIAITQLSQRSMVKRAIEYRLAIIGSDNLYPSPAWKKMYDVIAGQNRDNRIKPSHILNDSEFEFHVPWLPSNDVWNFIYPQCNARLPIAKMTKFNSPKTLKELCELGAPDRNVDLNNVVYAQRLERELSLIKEKGFEDYFFVLADMITYAKRHMLVGPARGSSCGSLVCYLIGITDVDPIQYGLLFERFIDITRMDLPDIDVDFQDDRRDMVFEYLKGEYGHENVARLGTISRFKPASSLIVAGKALGIPPWEIDAIKGIVMKRHAGDSRANLCVADTFVETSEGKDFIAKYPNMAIAAELEGRVSHSGQHAAGILITELPVSNFCSVDEHTGAAQIDKKDAESIGLLKIDALGLRTLSVIQDCLDNIGWSRSRLLDWPRDDTKTFDVLNREQFSGIFQFEGHALQGLCRQMRVENFEDIVSLTSLARPGPLSSGGAADFIMRRTGKKAVQYPHPLVKAATKITFGTIVYQEQVMQLGREVGLMSWEDVSTLRKAMGKILGKEYFDRFFDKFWQGAKSQGVTESEAHFIWDQMNTMGAYGFNRSHAVAYGLVSYWCMILKAYHPLEYAAACLRNSKDDESIVNMLRELANEGFKYKTFDSERSQLNWSVQNGELIGGLMNVIGIGRIKAEDILKRREEKTTYTPSQEKALREGKTPFDKIFEASERFGEIYADPTKFNIDGGVLTSKQILGAKSQMPVLFLGKLVRKKVTNKNGQGLSFGISDDEGEIKCRIPARNYGLIAKPIVEHGEVDKSWYLIRGKYVPDYNMVFVDKIKELT